MKQNNRKSTCFEQVLLLHTLILLSVHPELLLCLAKWAFQVGIYIRQDSAFAVHAGKTAAGIIAYRVRDSGLCSLSWFSHGVILLC